MYGAVQLRVCLESKFLRKGGTRVILSVGSNISVGVGLIRRVGLVLGIWYLPVLLEQHELLGGLLRDNTKLRVLRKYKSVQQQLVAIPKPVSEEAPMQFSLNLPDLFLVFHCGFIKSLVVALVPCSPDLMARVALKAFRASSAFLAQFSAVCLSCLVFPKSAW